MELVFDSTKVFEEELHGLQRKEQTSLVVKLNSTAQFLLDDCDLFYRSVFRPHRIMLRGGLESTLYVLRAGRDLRVIMTVDEDPIFGQIVITLLRVVRHKELDKVYRGLAESIYREWNA